MRHLEQRATWSQPSWPGKRLLELRPSMTKDDARYALARLFVDAWWIEVGDCMPCVDCIHLTRCIGAAILFIHPVFVCPRCGLRFPPHRKR